MAAQETSIAMSQQTDTEPSSNNQEAVNDLKTTRKRSAFYIASKILPKVRQIYHQVF